MERDGYGEGWRLHRVEGSVRVVIGSDMPVLDAALEREIGELWRIAQSRVGGGMFNGRVFCADRIGPCEIVGHWTEFRRLVAQFERPELFGTLQIRSLAVNGVVVGPDGVVFGRRPARAIYQGGLWQLAPAGSVDPSAVSAAGEVDFVRQVDIELQEELGIAFSAIERVEPIGVVEHAVSHVCDLGIALTTSLGSDAIRRAHASGGNGEYPELRVIAKTDARQFVKRAGAGLARQSHMFLQELGWLPTSGPPPASGQVGPP